MQTEENGGEVSMSVEETNRVRLSLGLKPLTNSTSAADERAAAAAAAAERERQAKKVKEAELAERIKAQKERRLEQEQLRKVKTLGEAGGDVDDLGAWVQRGRTTEAAAKQAEREKAAKLARQLDDQDEDADSGPEGDSDARHLAGMRVRHDAGELAEGETMVLTLADRGILDERGELDDGPEELENALMAEDKQRRKAFKAATKENKPLFGEDGVARGLLDKYDEEEAEAGMQIDDTGAVEAARRARQDDIRARLKAAESAATTTSASFGSGGDYYTQEEMATFQQPKTKKKRKLRKKGTDEPASLDIAALEAEAARNDAGADRGSRSQRAAREAEATAAAEAEQQRRQDRYENALNKANAASLTLQQAPAAAAPAAPAAAADDDDADDDLQQSLARARRAAQLRAEASRPSEADVAAQAGLRRETRERRERELGGGLEFSEAKDFANSIQLVKTEEDGDDAAALLEARPPSPAETEARETPAPPTEQPAKKPRASGGWVAAGGAAKEEVKEDAMEVDLPAAPPVKEEPGQESLVRERNVGVGLAGAMAMLRDRGELHQSVEWAGRNNDVRHHKLEDLNDIYSGGRHEERIAADIEQALTERDEFGRVLTPKERFRRLCHNFHGKTISKTKQEKRLRKLQEEMDTRRAATAEGTAGAFQRTGGHQMAGTPYVVLSGKLQPGQSSDPASGFATVDRQPAATPVPGGSTPRLGGGTTPLVGDRKVEVMLGLAQGKDAASKMPPPPPVSVRK